MSKEQFAIIKTGGKQYRVSEGDKISVEYLDTEPGKTVKLEEVLLVGGKDQETKIGTPLLKGAHVTAKVIENKKDKKIIIFKKRRRKGSKLKKGHRQNKTELLIEKLSA